MEDQPDSAMVSNGLVLDPGSDSKLVGGKRSIDNLEERHEISPKRLKKKDLDSAILSEEVKVHNLESLKRKELSQKLQFCGEGVSEVTQVPITFNFDGSQVESTNGGKLLAVVHPISRPLDLNKEILPINHESFDNNPRCEEKFEILCSQESNCVASKGIGLDLNAEDVSSSINHQQVLHKSVNSVKPKNVSVCGSSIGPEEENDSLRVWKEMKQNGFLSSSLGGISMQNGFLASSHGGVPAPKQRIRKSKNDVLKKQMELARKEQVDRFTKAAAPSGLLNGLNPGIINHVRNRKQVHSIIEALVKSEKLENLQQAIHLQIGTKDDDAKKDYRTMDDSGLRGLSCNNKDGPPVSVSKKVRGYLMQRHKPFSSISEERIGDGNSSMVDQHSDDDAIALKLSSPIKASENASSLSNEESADCNSSSSLSIKEKNALIDVNDTWFSAATVASQWLELLQQDIKGRLSALRRSKKKVRAVITTELPFLISKEFSSNQRSKANLIKTSDGFSNDATAEMHRARWGALFGRLDKALSEEERQLETWLNQIKGMQLHCDQGLQNMHWNLLYNLPQLGASKNNIRSGMGDRFEKDLAVRAAAASIYSACDFLLSKENVLCS